MLTNMQQQTIMIMGGERMPNNLTYYPELLYYRTKILKMTVEDTIAGLNMSTATYLRVENGNRELYLSEAKQIARNLNLSLETLFPKIFESKVAKNATN